MATAPQDTRADYVAMGEMPQAVVRQLFERERQGWLDRLLWDTADAADTAASAVASHLLDGAALRRSGRWEGFVAVQPGRPLARLCSGWLSPSVSDSEASTLVEQSLRRLPRGVRVEGQLVAFEAQPAFDRGFDDHGFQREDRDYLVADLDARILEATEGDAVLDGLRLHPLSALLLSDCAGVLVAAHRGGVEARINAAFRTERGAQEYLQEIVEGDGCGKTVPDASLAAVRDGRVEGFCLGTFVSAGVGHVPQVAVSPSAQGRGLGALLLGQSMRVMQRHGARRVTLSVSVRNERAGGWYARLGFAQATRFSAYYRD